ncbi:MAG: DUF6279 family lipoprotein [Betaproteobacteria bacterium]
MITTSNAVMFKSSLILRIIRQALCLLGLSALVLLSGCSALKLVYNQADEAVYWWLDSYVDLTDKQKPLAKDALRQLHLWHRQNQLPEYVALLQKVRAWAPHDIQPEQVCAVTQEIQNSFISALQQIEPDATKLISQLSEPQLQRIRKKYDKLNQEWRGDYLDVSEEKRLRNRNKQLLNRLEDFYGSLDAPQREAVQQWLKKSTFNPTISFKERQRRQADALQTFTRITHSGSQLVNSSQSQLRAWVDRGFTPPDEAVHAYGQTLRQENCDGFAKLHNSTTRAQRERLAENLINYENIVQSLVMKK